MPRGHTPNPADWDSHHHGMNRVARAADRAMEEVLEEDRLLREHGIAPPNGRSR